MYLYRRLLTCSFSFVGGGGLHLHSPLKNHCNATVAIQKNSERQKEIREHYDDPGYSSHRIALPVGIGQTVPILNCAWSCDQPHREANSDYVRADQSEDLCISVEWQFVPNWMDDSQVALNRYGHQVVGGWYEKAPEKRFCLPDLKEISLRKQFSICRNAEENSI